MSDDDHLSDQDYRALADFRFELRRFLHFSKERAREAGLQPAQHQALLAVRGAPDRQLSIGELGRLLFLKPHTASELASRLVDAGLLDRIEGRNARERLLRITPKGLDRLRELSRAHRDEVLRIRPLLQELLSNITTA